MRWTRSTVFRVRSLFFTYARPPPPGKRGCVCLGRAHKCQSVAVSARAGSRRPAALQPVASPRPFEHSVYSRTVVSVTMWSLSTCSSRFRRRRRLPFRWFSCARPPTHGGHPSCRPDRIFVCRRLPRLSHKPLRHRTSSSSSPPPHRPRRPPYLFVECVRSFGSFTVGPRSREYLDHQFLARSFRGHGRRRRTAAPRRGPLVFERRYRPRRYDSSFVPCDGPLITRLWYVLFADDPNYFDKLLTHLRTFLPFLTKVIDSSELLEIQPDHVTKLQCLYELVDNKRFAFGLKPYNMYTFVNYVYVIEQFAPVFGPSFLNRNIEISYIMTSFFLV